MLHLPMHAQSLELIELALRKGVCLTKGEEVSRAVLPPVRQNIGVDVNGYAFVKAAEGGVEVGA
ncbi:MAG: hypothetical protein ACI8W8_002055 [Rhodothermales bacterium]|jgi:hypothetical protein